MGELKPAGHREVGVPLYFSKPVDAEPALSKAEREGVHVSLSTALRTAGAPSFHSGPSERGLLLTLLLWSMCLQKEERGE